MSDSFRKRHHTVCSDRIRFHITDTEATSRTTTLCRLTSDIEWFYRVGTPPSYRQPSASGVGMWDTGSPAWCSVVRRELYISSSPVRCSMLLAVAEFLVVIARQRSSVREFARQAISLPIASKMTDRHPGG
jgi:hypothetical protein